MSVIREKPNQIISLAFDEVNDNVEEFISLRGEGRYFGVTDPEDPNANITGPKCKNCHKRGHIKAECKTVVCLLCGAHDDHYSNNCPKSITCTNCGKSGHYRNACTERIKRIYCQECSSNKHTSDKCPTIWRSYVTMASYTGGKKGLPTNIFCYNCADKGHYGDECNEIRSSRTPNQDGSAFAGDNLPSVLRDKYRSLVSSMRKRPEEREEYLPPHVQERRREHENYKKRREQEYQERSSGSNRFQSAYSSENSFSKRKRLDDDSGRDSKIRKIGGSFSHSQRSGPQSTARGGSSFRGGSSRGGFSGQPTRGGSSSSGRNGFGDLSYRRNGFPDRGPPGGGSRGGKGGFSRSGGSSSGSQTFNFPRGGGSNRPSGEFSGSIKNRGPLGGGSSKGGNRGGGRGGRR